MIVTFIGHRKIAEKSILYSNLRDFILWLVDYKNADTFLFGSKSQFNDLCLQAATEVKKIRPNVKLIYVRAEYPHISEDYKNYLLNFYDDTYFPDKILNAGRAAYIERNYHMIDRANICIFYSTRLPPLSAKKQQTITLSMQIKRLAEQRSLMIMPYPKRKQ